VVGSVGLGLLGAPALARAGAGEALGVAVLLLGAVTWAWATIHVREHRWTASTWELQPWQLLVGLVPLSVVALVVEQGRGIAWDTTTVLVLLYSGPLATAFGFWAILTVTRVLGPLAAGVGFLAVPVVGLITGWLVLGERLGAIDAAASALVLVGIAATSLGEDAVPSDAAGATHP
jgi:drug/metabolite transporter (DMT)-like permease